MFGYFWVGLGGSDMYRVFLIVDGCRSIGVPRGKKTNFNVRVTAAILPSGIL